MAKFLITASYSPEGLTGVIAEGFQARMETVTTLIEATGGSIEAIYFAYGEADLVAIIDGSEEAALALSMAVKPPLPSPPMTHSWAFMASTTLASPVGVR